ncbi:MAG: metallophosphoesterase family protein [Verrucomicrobia bacterium]|nr:metallophosphoesterase family protein [Verrucomicrobiota bacterium]
MTLGLISDTHGLLDPKVFELFAGVDHILHGGDIGPASLIWELEKIAPVTAVLGNNDGGLTEFRETEIAELGGRKFLVHHIVNPHRLVEPAAGRIARARPDVVVFGHTHQPFAEQIGPTFFCNPGYAGRPRFGQARSVALVTCDERGVRAKFLAL